MNDGTNFSQTDQIRTGYNYLKRMIPIIFLFIILFFSTWVHFDGITEQGMNVGFRYLKEAKLCATGQPMNWINW